MTPRRGPSRKCFSLSNFAQSFTSLLSSSCWLLTEGFLVRVQAEEPNIKSSRDSNSILLRTSSFFCGQLPDARPTESDPINSSAMRQNLQMLVTSNTCCPEFDGFAVWRVPVGVGPGFFALKESRWIGQALRRN